ncbi:response regulator [uncultured Azohydromonas sp.]|jgi:Signal transduction histidine kinase|uniref:hybrid sensor histidine kinase/response regulator n=1 Tax=uncultured Azohydromonas sp. TaxID=487342 RepID=UPI0026357A8B|nr:response regulator [uncultured Azohydromonas sp.]
MPLTPKPPAASSSPPPVRSATPTVTTLPDEEEAVTSSILIVDDLREKHLVFRALLEDLGQELISAYSGAEALREVLRREFAVILLDVNMPDMDGLETARLIRQYKRAAHTPIIFITAYADEVQTHRGYELGAVDYIMSPVVPQVLRSKVQVFVDLHVMQRRVRRQAEQRVALVEAEAARRAAERTTWRSNFLSQVSGALSASLDAEVAMRRLLELVVPTLSPCAALQVCTATTEATPQRLLVARGDAADRPVAFAEHALHEMAPSVREAFVRALSERRPQALEENSCDALDEAGGDAGAAPAHRLPHGVAMPLPHGTRVLGVLFVAAQPDQDLLRSLCERAALAFENARLYRTLQAEIEERRHAQEQLTALNRRKDEFLAMLSHELRNPLAPIRNAVEVIRRIAPAGHPRLAWATDVMDRQVRHMTELVEELLDVARISQGKIVLQMRPIDLLPVVAHGIETARPLLDGRRHQLKVQLPAAPVWLRGDFARLSQVVSNLLNNAAKYTHEGGLVELSLQVARGQAEVSVRDNGIGIEAALLPTVFELFEQGQRSLDRSQGGLGVGLTLVQRLVQLHHGDVEVRSAGPGRGSEFIVRLPCLAEVEAPAPAESANPVQAAETRGCRVLAVDDNIDAADTVAMFLRMEGHSVETAHSGPEAVERAKAFQPEVVLLDIGLPGMDGFEVVRHLRALPATQHALVIALTGYGQKSDQAQAQQAGFDHHLVKPADIAALAALIEQWRARRAAGAGTAGSAGTGGRGAQGGT